MALHAVCCSSPSSVLRKQASKKALATHQKSYYIHTHATGFRFLSTGEQSSPYFIATKVSNCLLSLVKRRHPPAPPRVQLINPILGLGCPVAFVTTLNRHRTAGTYKDIRKGPDQVLR